MHIGAGTDQRSSQTRNYVAQEQQSLPLSITAIKTLTVIGPTATVIKTIIKNYEGNLIINTILLCIFAFFSSNYVMWLNDSSIDTFCASTQCKYATPLQGLYNFSSNYICVGFTTLVATTYMLGFTTLVATRDFSSNQI